MDTKYIRNLAKADDHVMSVSPQAGKETQIQLYENDLDFMLKNINQNLKKNAK